MIPCGLIGAVLSGVEGDLAVLPRSWDERRELGWGCRPFTEACVGRRIKNLLTVVISTVPVPVPVVELPTSRAPCSALQRAQLELVRVHPPEPSLAAVPALAIRWEILGKVTGGGALVLAAPAVL